MREYTLLINEIFNAIKPVLPDNKHPYTGFSEGSGKTEMLSSQEIAILRYAPAYFFVKVIHDNSVLFKIDKNEYKVKPSITVRLERTVSYTHSCYPKNIRRWLKGTIPRRKKSRIEFCTLAYCWAVGWKDEPSYDNAHLECQEELRSICKKYGCLYPQDSLIKVLWDTMELVYYNKTSKAYI